MSIVNCELSILYTNLPYGRMKPICPFRNSNGEGGSMELIRVALPVCAEGYLGTFLVMLIIAGAVKLASLLP